MFKAQMRKRPYISSPPRGVYTGAGHSTKKESLLEAGLGLGDTKNSPNRSGCKVKVIVADDEQVTATTLTIVPNHAGFEACAFSGGEAAIEALNSFDLYVLISDAVIPDMSGIQAAIVIRSKQPNCKVLLFSEQAVTADLLQDARAQGHSFEITAMPIHFLEMPPKLRVVSLRIGR